MSEPEQVPATQNVQPVETAEVSSTSDVNSADRTLAQEVAENEYHMYQQSQQLIQEIEAEVRQTQELCAKKEEISELVKCYNPETSPSFYLKAQELSEKYGHIRRIRGDGNCFYRAVLTALLEKCFEDRELLDKTATLLKGWRERLFKFDFPRLTTGDFCDSIDTLMTSVQDNTKSINFLFDDLNDDSIANYYVAYMRLITSGYLRENEIIYSDFIEGLRTLEQYCKDEVEPMWKDCDHICIIALVNAIDVPIRIEYMDQSQAPNGGWAYNVPEDAEPKLFFLYRPGHYDILYNKA